MKLDAATRNAIPGSKFALPGRRFPVEDKSHASAAKSRATQGVNSGSLSEAQAETIRSKANRVLKGK